MESNEVAELLKAVAGLEYPSESDAPFDVIQWPGKVGMQEQVVAHGGAGRKVVEVPLDLFFGDLKDSDDMARFLELRKALEKNLTGFRIFRVGDGEMKVDIYILGKTRGGDWAGVHTSSVET